MMNNALSNEPAEVFISYARSDQARVFEVCGQLEKAGVSFWRDQERILGGEYFGNSIVSAIKDSKVLLLMCSLASMRSKNVKQEIQLSWAYNKPYLPLLLERIEAYSDQIRYWLEGCQWIEVLDSSTDCWFPCVLRSLASLGVKLNSVAIAEVRATEISLSKPPDLLLAESGKLTSPRSGLSGLLAIARFTDLIWPVPADSMPRQLARYAMRGLGAPQQHVKRNFALNSRMRLVIEVPNGGHLLLLDEGPEGNVYCLCPSQFAPDTSLSAGRNVLPSLTSRHESFELTGKPGREHLLAIVSDVPLGFDWHPTNREIPARLVSEEDIQQLTGALRALSPGCWTALATYFDVIL